jgi:predicted acylesterase/phospholipase RssA
MSRQAVVVSVVGLTRGGPVDAVASAVAAGLGRRLRVFASSGLEPDGLAAVERDHDRVVLSAPFSDAGPGRAWWSSCLRQADRLVLVARSDDTPPESWAGPDQPDLVLVGPVPPAHVLAAWSDVLRPWQIVLVRGGALAGDLRSLVARLGGWSLGLVLAGGGARAFTHIGVLRALEEAGLEVDRVAGASIGAVVAGVHARGHDGPTLEAICYEEFVRQRPFSDYTLPVASMAKGRRTADALRRRMGEDTRIESLPRQFRCVSTDLLARAPHVHRSGLLWEAITASARLPVLFPPMRVEGRLLVDGGVLDNLPVGLLTERDEGPIVAVDVSMGNGAPSSTPRGPRPLRIPALGETLLRTMMIGSSGGAARARAGGAYVITPPSMGVGLLEFHQMDRMVEAGRMATRSLLEATGGDLA